MCPDKTGREKLKRRLCTSALKSAKGYLVRLDKIQRAHDKMSVCWWPGMRIVCAVTEKRKKYFVNCESQYRNAQIQLGFASRKAERVLLMKADILNCQKDIYNNDSEFRSTLNHNKTSATILRNHLLCKVKIIFLI